MKSIKTTPPAAPQYPISYPVLMEAPNGSVVLFTSDKEGTIINDAPEKLGTYSETWISAQDAHWKHFEGKIELSN